MGRTAFGRHRSLASEAFPLALPHLADGQAFRQIRCSGFALREGLLNT